MLYVLGGGGGGANTEVPETLNCKGGSEGILRQKILI